MCSNAFREKACPFVTLFFLQIKLVSIILIYISGDNALHPKTLMASYRSNVQRRWRRRTISAITQIWKKTLWTTKKIIITENEKCSNQDDAAAVFFQIKKPCLTSMEPASSLFWLPPSPSCSPLNFHASIGKNKKCSLSPLFCPLLLMSVWSKKENKRETTWKIV